MSSIGSFGRNVFYVCLASSRSLIWILAISLVALLPLQVSAQLWGGGGGGGGGPQVTNVTILSGSEVRVTYTLDQNYPTSGTHTPYAQLMKGDIEVDRITPISGTSGTQTVDMDCGTTEGSFQVNLILDPTGTGAGTGRKFFLDNGTVTLDSVHHQLLGESGVWAVPYTNMNPNCDLERGGSSGGGGSKGPGTGGVGPGGPNGGCCEGVPKPDGPGLKSICVTYGGPNIVCGGAPGAAFSLSYYIPSLINIDLGAGTTSTAQEDCDNCDGGILDAGPSGCGSCDGGSGGGIRFGAGNDMPDLSISFRPHKVGKFGGGLSLGFELDTYGSNIHLFMSENSIPVVFLNETTGMPLVAFEDDLDGDPVDGVLYDQIGFYKKAELQDANGNVVSTLSAATKLIVTRHRGGTMEFELIDPIDGDPTTDKDGRLTEVLDRNGFGSTITYSGNDFKIDKITDYHGNEMSFTYGADQMGQIAISTITMPCSKVATMAYNSDGLLSGVTMNDGWECSVDYTSNPTSQTTFVEFTGAVGDKGFHLTQDYIELDGQLLNQPLNVLRGIDDAFGNNEVSFFVDSQDPHLIEVLRGDDALSTIRAGEYEQFAEDFSITGSGNLMEISILTQENEYGQNDFLTQYTDQRWILGAPPRIIDESGNIVDQEFDSDWYLTKRTFGDGTYEEWDRNNFKQVTRYRDRLGRVSKYEYDTNGNLTKKKVGILEVSGSDVNQAEYAEYKWDYYTTGPLKGMLKTEYSPRHSGESDIYRTDIEYYDTAPNIGRLKKVILSADTSGGTRPEINYAYDTCGRLSTVTDPEGRVTTAVYDSLHRVVEIQYNDTSKSQVVYGNTLGEYGKVVKSRDRVGTVTEYSYDDYGRVTEVKVASATDADIRDGQADDSPITEPWKQDITTYDYVVGTNDINFVVSNGKMMSYDYDYRRRIAETTQYPSAGKTLVSKSEYVDNDLFYTEDPYGRKEYLGYRASDGQLIRRVKGTSPGFTLASNSAVINQTRDLSNNAQYIVLDAIRDAEGQLTDVVDGRGITTKAEFDSRGRSIRTLAAYGTTMEAKTETDYDVADNVVETRSPRYFDSSDPEYQNVKTTFTYNGRELESSRTEAPGTSIAATTHQTYTLDSRSKKRTDARGNDWTTEYHSCCGRFLGREDPQGQGSFSNTDYEGRITHTATVADYATHTSSHDPIDAKTYNETTTKFDELGRSVASTRWLNKRGNVDANAPPIAGLSGISASEGLTSQTVYDSNLGDGQGLDSATGVTVNILGGGTYTLSLSTLITQLSQTPANGGGGITFGTTSAGSATVSISGEEEISVSITDAAGRTVISAQLEPHTDTNTGDLITWNCQQYDNTYTKTGFGDLVETWSIDALGNISKSRTDGGGRTLESVDAGNNVSTSEYDAGGNVKKSRDPNGVGYDAVYDDLGRATNQTDTYGDTTTTGYNLAGNVVTQTDAKSKTTTTVFDARGRRVSVTDRLSGTTAYTYDLNSNLKTITDAESKTTSYDYDSRNAKTKETYPDHVGGTSSGNTGYGIVEFSFDPAGRLEMRTDQLGDTVTYVYDLAGRMEQRDYRTKANSPSGTISDSDIFTYDASGRTLTAESERYDNVVTMVYDDAGRISTETVSNSGRAYTTTRAYDDRGILDKLTYHDGAVVDRVVDERGLLEELKLNSSNIADWQFDAGGRRTQQNYSSGVVTTFGYRDDSNGKDNLLASINTAHPSGSSTRHVGNYTYTYDANKNKTSETISGQMSAYGFNSAASPATYDDEDRLTGWNRTDGNQDQSWGLSLVGDWDSFTEEAVTETRTQNDVHELTQITGGSIAGSLTYDAKGNLTQSSDGQKYTYDFDNQISTIDIDGNGTADRQNKYDALGRRVMYHDGTKWFDYVVADRQLLMVYETNGNAQTRYIFGSYVDEPILVERDLSGTPEKFFYHRNQQYSVVALTKLSDGLTDERYIYDARGKTTIFDNVGTTARSSSNVSNNFMYTGRFYDGDAEVYYFRARWYDPELGRFISRDPLGYVDGMSLYRGYFGLRGKDPTGTQQELGEVLGGISVIAGGTPTAKDEKRSPTECCTAWRTRWEKRYGKQLKPLGGIVCCDGRIITCAWRIDRIGPDSPGRDIVISCIHEHERDHFDSIEDCGETDGWGRDIYRCGWNEEVEDSIRKQWNDECDAYLVEYLCLKRNRHKCRGNADCLKIVDAQIENAKRGIRKYCGGVGRDRVIDLIED